MKSKIAIEAVVTHPDNVPAEEAKDVFVECLERGAATIPAGGYEVINAAACVAVSPCTDGDFPIDLH